MILVDTSVWVDFLNSSRGPAGDELERLIRANAQLALTGVVVTEVLQGLKRDVAEVTRLLSLWPLIEPSGFPTYAAAGGVFRHARQRGLTISTIDALVAALAIEYKAALFTLDKDSGRLEFAGLQLYGLTQEDQ